MEKKTFYTVAEDVWMFRKAAAERVASNKKWAPHEEAVRQWCIQELIRKYGVRIDRIKVECQVKVARERRPHRVDVVVLRDGQPHIVVECKARSIKKLDDALQQAMNYAVLPDMQATFAVATNGDAWLVRRRVNTDWVPVADLPQYREGKGSVEWRLILLAVQDLSPILFWLDRPVPAKHAPCYFSALQRLFYGSNEITAATDHNLLRAADRLLRVLAQLDNHAGYTGGKMDEACKFLNGFWASRGIETDFGGGNLWEMAHCGYAELSALVEDNAGTAPLDAALLRVFLSLFAYLNDTKAPKRVKYVDVSDSVQREIRSYLNLALVVRFNAELPDTLDKTYMGDIHAICKPAWLRLMKDLNGFSWALLPGGGVNHAIESKLLAICRSGVLGNIDEETLPEPYIPFVPDKWNGGLVLAEAQNHGAKSREYLEWLLGLNSKDRMLRLNKHALKLGCQPWDDGSLKFALACVFESAPERWAVGNAVLWSRVHPSGRNDNPSERMTENSIKVWSEYLKVLKPRLIVTAGKVARDVVARVGFQGQTLRLTLPSPSYLSRTSCLFSEADLLERYPEVRQALRARPDLIEGRYRLNRIFYACHAVSVAGAILGKRKSRTVQLLTGRNEA